MFKITRTIPVVLIQLALGGLVFLHADMDGDLSAQTFFSFS